MRGMARVPLLTDPVRQPGDAHIIVICAPAKWKHYELWTCSVRKAKMPVPMPQAAAAEGTWQLAQSFLRTCKKGAAL